jgi:hypothetical protein
VLSVLVVVAIISTFSAVMAGTAIISVIATIKQAFTAISLFFCMEMPLWLIG